MLTPTAGSLIELPRQWWIAHTKARFEKAFAWDMHRRGIGYFLPLAERVRRSGGRKRTMLIPLFPSYVFFNGDADARYSALATNRLCTVIPVTDQDKLVHELVGIEKAVMGNAQLDLYPFVVVGTRCRITAGPFAGLEGVVTRRDGVDRFVLQVSILGQGAVMEIDGDRLEPIEGRADRMTSCGSEF
jgi:transcription antitermination factor NusG